MVPSMKDARGAESKTLTFVTGSYAVTTVKFALASLTVHGVQIPAMTGTEYAACVVAILGIWLGREWRAARD